MPTDDLQLLAASRSESPPDPAARDRALAALIEHTHTHPARRWGLRPRVLMPLAAVGAAAAAAVAVLVSSGPSAPAVRAHHHTNRALASVPANHHASASHHASHHSVAAQTPLARLAEFVDTSGTPSGDATVVKRTTTTGGNTVSVYDLYGDNGEYFFSRDASGLPAQVRADHNLANGLFAREVAAAKEADGGQVQAGARDMVDAPNPGRIVPRVQKIDQAAVAAKEKAVGEAVTPASPTGFFDNWAWGDSLDALTAGAGDPTVRAGVLKILATIPGVTVTDGTLNGQSTLVLTAAGDEFGGGYTEQLTIDAQSGVPLHFTGGPSNGPAATTVDYKVSRVTIAGLAASTGTGS